MRSSSLQTLPSRFLEATWKDYISLLKPRVMSLVIFTALIGLLLAPQTLHPYAAFLTVLAIATGAGGSAALNMWYDADIDTLMKRTATRPIPSGLVDKTDVLVFGLLLSGLSTVVLGLATNWLAAFLLAFTIFFYAVVYTMWLKRFTAQNIVIGGAAGALPPVVAWAAATGSIDAMPLVLFGIIFLWTPPHFWALSLCMAEDYKAAKVPMMPLTHGVVHTLLNIKIYTLLLVLFSYAPLLFGAGGVFFLLNTLAMLCYGWSVVRLKEGDTLKKRAGQSFGVSIFYLFFVFGALLLDKSIGLPLFFV